MVNRWVLRYKIRLRRKEKNIKLGDYQFTIGVRQDLSLADVLNNMQTIINNGRYQMRVVSIVPNWVGDEGEHLLYVSGTTRRFYVYDTTNSTWQYIEWTNPSGGAAYGNKILDSAGTTGIYTEYSAAEQTLRFYINSVYQFSINASGISVSSDVPVSFNGLNGNDYVKFNSSANLLQFYMDGNVRMEM